MQRTTQFLFLVVVVQRRRLWGADESTCVFDLRRMNPMRSLRIYPRPTCVFSRREIDTHTGRETSQSKCANVHQKMILDQPGPTYSIVFRLKPKTWVHLS